MTNTATLRRRAAAAGLTLLLAVGVSLGAAGRHATQDKSTTPINSADVASAKSLSNAFRAASDKVLPAVVAIENRPKLAQSGMRQVPDMSDRFGGRNPFQGTPFEDFFKGMPEGQVNPQFRHLPNAGPMGIGSGVIIDPSGVILTNNHVVEGGGEVTVRLNDGREFKAASVATDPKTDLAIVRIEGAKNLVAAELADSDQVEVGDWVLALGQPFGLESTVTAGIVSATHRGIGITDRESFIQTDAAINPGNSGGPLVDLDGRIVGINTAISSRSGGNNGIGFAVPANLASWVVKQLETDGVVHRAYLGVGIQPVTQEIAGQFGVRPREGVVVTQVYPDTPAAKMGLREGDVITHLDGEEVGSAGELQLLVEQTELGKTHPMKVVRDGKSLKLAFSPEAQPESFGARVGQRSSQLESPQAKPSALGMGLDNLTPEVGKQLGLTATEGVVVTEVDNGSRAAEAGIQPGMVIRQINRQEVQNADDARQLLSDADPDESVLLLVQTGAGSRFVVIER
ncbi:Periplasmic serine endoprotease DegP precursor [Posidoniimonas corsicana]|uniref:Periplasmic serine endoprotease DegP n=1 Tax=Posidoniimonas corsicana TaxID=1938618 RepID=A0A5C5VER2_9BACT|nr:Do family serine endopeptidase [Posidoniimonas corsicana]TWT37124.1 Periplasmic serine endoprotease DegP precursor [Posidoniimonas corsicana]